MAVKKRGLGRGLDALLSGARPASATLEADTRKAVESAPAGVAGAAAETASQDGDLKTVPIEFIQPGRYQPRLDMHPEKLEELASSIRAQGIMQPIVVRPVGANRYEIIAGERRWRACQLAQLDHIPVIIKEVPDNAAIAMA